MAKKKSKNPVGRPKFEINEEVLQRAERLMAQGLTKEQCARALGVSVSTFQLYQAENSEFSEAIKRGEALGIEEVTNALFENATHKVETENKVTLDLTRIGVNELAAIERAFEQSHCGASQSGEIPQIIEGVYEERMADD